MLKIKIKFIALVLLGFVGLSTTLAIFYYTTSTTLYNERKKEARRLIEAANGGMQFFYSLEQSGMMSREEAQQHASHTIGSLRYGKNGYFWVNDTDGVMITHPITDFVGQNLLDRTDNQGTYLFKDFIAKAKEGGGWTFYNWPKPGELDSWYSKVSYVSPFEPWDWIIGTGLYLDDIEAEIRRITLHIGIIIFSIYAPILLISLYAAHHFMKQLGELAIRDPLTSMFTRRYMDELTSDLIANHNRNPQTTLAAIFYDIDHFKNVNDTYGHVTGDKVLKEVAKSIVSTIRQTDIAIRYGGEEFIVISQLDRKQDLVDFAERIRRKCAGLTFTQNQRHFTITMSAGLAIRKTGENMTDLIHRADQQLYLAKENGRDRLETADVETRCSGVVKLLNNRGSY